ncbi:torsin-1A-interacting protein 1-like [Littorina saxatilis]|uniref:Torsin-1A-interacting protein 1/2 AAA+ activator domain-containing protein n=1 Tax=Littorina saxatilis TaxID=31220 RepID=A0AAN9G450_9CAEN
MSRSPYNLRRNPPKRSPYKEEEEEEEEDSEEEETRSPRQRGARNTSHRAQSDDSYISDRDYNSSALSTTASESFDYHPGTSPSESSEGGKYKKLYPPLPSGSPGGGERSPRSSPEVSSQRLSGVRRHSLESSSSQGKKDKEKVYSFWQWFCVVAIVLLLVYLISNRLVSKTEQISGLQNKPVSFLEFLQKMDELKGKFPGQSERFWKVVTASAKHVLDSDRQSTYPAILLMVAKKSNAALAASIAQAVAEAFESTLRGQTSSHLAASLNLTTHPGKVKSDSQKLELDNWLREKLEHSHDAVVVNHLETLEPNAALLLHGYCDGDNAPYKNAMLILGLFVESAVDNSKAAEAVLRDLWTADLTEDKVGALLSRVANNVALVSESKQ